jgi:hypothetical protein
MLPCTGSLASHSVSRNAASSTKPSERTRVLAYCCGTRICRSRSNGFSVDAFGRDVGDKHVDSIGKM